MEDKKTTAAGQTEQLREVNPEELDLIIGGNNPFADVPRVKSNDYDQTVKDKI